MKRFLAVISFLLLTIPGRPIFAGMFGSPEPLAKEDGNSLGVGYFSSSEKFKSREGSSEITVVQKQTYGEVTSSGYNFSETGEGFLRVGMADFDGGGLSSGSKFAVNAGMREQLYRSGQFCVGTVIQGSYFGKYEEKIISEITSVKLKITGKWDASLGLGFQYRLLDMLRIYAGPYVGYASFKSERTAVGATPTQSSDTYRTKRPVGGFAGARAVLYKGLNAVGEVRFGSDVSGGVALSYSF